MLTAIKARRPQGDGYRLGITEDFRGVSAIKTLAERQRIFFRFQTQGRRLREEAANDLFVFFGLKAACAVNQCAARFQQTNYSACDG